MVFFISRKSRVYLHLYTQYSLAGRKFGKISRSEWVKSVLLCRLCSSGKKQSTDKVYSTKILLKHGFQLADLDTETWNPFWILHLIKNPIKSEFHNYLIPDFANKCTPTNKNKTGSLVLFLTFRVKDK